MRRLYFLFAITVVVSGFDFVVSDDCKYIPEFAEDVRDCDGFSNEIFKADGLNAKLVSDDEGMGLTGSIILDKELQDGVDVEIEVAKETDYGKEPVFRTQGGFCSSIKEKNTPWEPLVKAMNITGCPVAPDTFNVKDMLVNLAFAQDILTHQYVGFYETIFRLVNGDKEIACFLVTLSISERCE